MPDSLHREPPQLLACATPRSLFQSVCDALAPHMEEGGVRRAYADNSEKLVGILRPALGHFTVADAVAVCIPMDEAAGIGCYGCNQGGALECVSGLLEDFICAAPPTSPHDVGARSGFVLNHQRRASQRQSAVLLHRLALDIYELQHNNFREGQYFSGEDAHHENPCGNRPWWLRIDDILREVNFRDA